MFRALAVWRAEGSPATATGVCSACMGEITFSRSGQWNHNEVPATTHGIPAVILAESQE